MSFVTAAAAPPPAASGGGPAVDISSFNRGGGAPDQPARILVVDDAAVIRLYYRHLLESGGYVVAEATNGIEGLEKAFQTRFDLCILDINMPLLDGHGFLQALRREPVTRSLPALVTSTEAGPDDRQAAFDAGADAYLVKPVAGDVLAAQVAALLARAP